MIVASVKGFGPGPYEDCKVYENVAQCAGGSASTTGFDDGPPLVTGAQIGDSRHRTASRARHRRRALPAQHDGARPARAGGDAGRRAEPLPRQAARPAAARAHRRDGGIPAVSERQVRRRRAALGQRVRRRPARLDPEVQGLGDRPQRLHLLHHAGAGVEGHLRGDRQAGMAHRSALRDAEGAAAAPDGDLRARSRNGPRPRPSSRRWTSSTSATSRAVRSCR